MTTQKNVVNIRYRDLKGRVQQIRFECIGKLTIEAYTP